MEQKPEVSGKYKLTERFLGACASTMYFETIVAMNKYIDTTIEKVHCFYVSLTGKTRTFDIRRLPTRDGFIVQVYAPKIQVHSTRADMFLMFRAEDTEPSTRFQIQQDDSPEYSGPQEG